MKLNTECEKSQKILEDIISEAYFTPGSSMLETDGALGPNNLFSLIAKNIREWVLEGGDVLQTERKWDSGSAGVNPVHSDKELLKKYYSLTRVHLTSETKKEIY